MLQRTLVGWEEVYWEGKQFHPMVLHVYLKFPKLNSVQMGGKGNVELKI